MDTNYKHEVNTGSDFTQADFDLMSEYAMKSFKKYILTHPGASSAIGDDERSDMIEDAIIKMMDASMKKGKIIDTPLMRVIAERSFIDHYKKKLRDKDRANTDALSIDALDTSDHHTDLADPRDQYADVDNEGNTLSEIVIGMLDIFDKGSNEYEYIEYILNEHEVIDTGVKGDPNKLRQNKGYSDSHFAVSHGFPGTGSSRWKTFKWNIIKKLYEYFSEKGIDLNDYASVKKWFKV